jgi:hypothetical protein
MLDEFRVKAPAGFPDHPHRGFETVKFGMNSYILGDMNSYILGGMNSYILGGMNSYILGGMNSYILGGVYCCYTNNLGKVLR